MGLRFIIGRSRSGKTSLCLNEIKEKQKLGKRLIYIVPEQYSLQAERELVDVSGGIVSAVVLSFRRLAENIFSERGGLPGKHLSDTGKLVLLRRILMRNKEKLAYFGVVCGRQGFINRLGDAVSEFFAYGVTPDDIKRYAEGFSEDSAINSKLNDISLIYSEYCSFIKSEYVSSDDMLSIAAGKMIGARYTEGAEVWLDGFYGFTFQELNIINRLLASCSTVNITLNMDTRLAHSEKLSMENSFFEPWDTMRKLKKICSDNGYTVEKPVLLNESYYVANSMKRLEKEYLGWNINKKSDSEGIRIFSAVSIDDEINMCASEIIHLVRDKGMRYRDIALTARVLDDYREQVSLVFSHYGIPFFMDTKRSVMGHPCTELVRSIIDLVSCNISYESMFRCLKTELTPITRDDRDLLENYVIRYGIKGETWINVRWQWGFEHEESAEKEDKINLLKDMAIAPFLEFYKKYKKGTHSVKDITLDIYSILEKLELAERLGEKAENAEAEGDIESSQEQIRCFELIGELMENMVSLLGDDSVTIKEYGEIFEAGLSGLQMGIIPAGIDTVTVGDIERTRLPNIKALFVVGANEGILPSNNTETKGVFTDREIQALEEAGAELSHTGARLAFEEQYLIYMGITKPSEQLYLCRNMTDGSGRETRPSSVIARLENIFPAIEHRVFNNNSLKSIDRPIPVLHRLGKGLADGEALWEETGEWLINSTEYSGRALMIKKGTELKNIECRLSLANLRKLYGGKLYTSVSRLETFAECPFYYFARYSLGAKPRRVYEIQTPDLGSLFHEVLEKFTLDMKSKGLTWQTITEEEAKEMTENAVDELAPDMGSRILLSTAAHTYMLKRIKRITQRAVSVLKKHMNRGKFETLGSEITFGSGELPAIAITMPNGNELLLKGKIDRVDIYRKDGSGYIKIIDYKSGRKDFNLSDIYYGLQLQLLLYMDAFIKTGKILTRDEPQVGGAFYFRIMDPVIKAADLKGNDPETVLFRQFCMTGLACNEPEVLEALDEAIEESGKSEILNVSKKKDGSISGSAVERDKYDKLMEYAAQKAGELGKEISEGNVSISPVVNGNVTPCDYCDYNTVFCFDKKNGNKPRKLKRLTADEVWSMVLSGK